MSEPVIERVGSRHDNQVAISHKFWAVMSPFFTGHNKDRTKSLTLLVGCVVLLGIESAVLVGFSYTQRDFSTAMSNKDQAEFYRGTQRYVALLLAAAPLFAASKFVQGKLSLDWRRWLTEHLCGMYFGNRAFYSLKMAPTCNFSAASVPRGASKDLRDGEGGGFEGKGEKRGKIGEEQGGGIDNPISAVDNPDQRIGEDISTFTQNCISVLVVFVGSLLKLGSFIGVLLSISPTLTVFVALYSLFGTAMTTYMFGATLKHLTFEGAKREANFRFGLVRVREHAEEIAFYRGEKEEEAGVRHLLDKVVSNTHLKLWCDARLAVMQNTFMWLTSVLPYLVVAERYFAGEIEFGVITQTAMAFRVIQNALSVVVTQLRTLASLASEVDRLHFLLVTVERINDDAKSKVSPTLEEHAVDYDYVAVPTDDDSSDPVKFTIDDDAEEDYGGSNAVVKGGESSPALSTRSMDGFTMSSKRITTAFSRASSTVLGVENMTLVTPDGKGVICRQLSFSVEPGQSVLVFGPSGCGKSSLLRAVAGLWTNGRGIIRRCADEKSMFIPQKPYLPLGSLKAQMIYPMSEDWSLLDDSALEGILEDVQLGYLSKRYGDLDQTRDWQDELSLGEQQRLAFCRFLTNKPSVVFLDEATSALDEKNETKLYEWLKASRVDAFVSVGHRASLFRYHTHVLRGQSDGRWIFHTMDDFLKKHYSPTLAQN